MSRKSKIMAALAITAVMLIVASGVVRCSIAGSHVQQDEQPGASGSAIEASNSSDGGESEFKSLAGSSWSKDDGVKLALSDTSIVKTTQGSSEVCYYTVEEEESSGGSIYATLSISQTMNGPQEMAVVSVQTATEDGKQTLTCDQLGGTYMRDQAGETHVTLAGDNEELFELSGKTQADFEETLSMFAQSKSPHATKATWDKEVWIDCSAHTMLTNFTLDDPTGTFVTVTKDATGRLMAQ